MFRNDLDWLDYCLNEKGYLLHGSPHQLGRLTPQQAHDTERQSGCYKAVYATRHRLVAIVSSLLARSLEPGFYHTLWECNGSDIRVVGYNADWGDRGYVYVLHPAYFEPLYEGDGSFSGEYISRQPVEPEGVITFTREILERLPISFQFYPPRALQ